MIDRLLAGVVLAALVGMGALAAAWSVDAARLRSERDAVRAELAQVRASVAEQRAEFEAQARAQETAQRRAMDEIAERYERELQDAQAEHDRVAADLERGSLRLRAHWQGCEATADLSRAAEAAARVDEAADLRRAGAGALVSIGDSCDAQIRGLQRVIEAWR